MSPCTDTIPRACAESFAEIRQALGRIEAIAQATHAQATRTNGSVGELFAAGSRQRTELARLEVRMEELGERQAQQESLARTVLAAGWKLSLMLAGVVASLLGIKHLFNR